MSVEITELANGLRVVTDNMPGLATTSLGVWVASGSRHEQSQQNGISHLLEHMAFKGTKTRTAKAIAEEIEALGGDLNAATGHETTAYYARVLSGDEGHALTILADILQNSLFAEEELRREQDVIVQEIAATQDNPEDIVFDMLHEAAFPGQALGRPILGTPDRVLAFSPDDLKAYLAHAYRPQKMVVAAAGKVGHETLVRHAEALFQAPNQPESGDSSPARYGGGVRWSNRTFEQCHLALGFEGPNYRDARYFTAHVFSGVLGGGMSSRLFQEAREARGLCYSIYSAVWGLEDTGMTYLHSATSPELTGQLADVIANTLDALSQSAPEPSEIDRAKAQLKVGLLSALESAPARAEQLARHLMVHGRVIAKEDIIARVDAVTRADLLEFAQQLRSGSITLSLAGAGQQAESLSMRAKETLLPTSLQESA